jgi:hypothetical protein
MPFSDGEPEPTYDCWLCGGIGGFLTWGGYDQCLLCNGTGQIDEQTRLRDEVE